MSRECQYEARVLAAVLAGLLDDTWDDGLRRHVVACERCASALAVASAVRAERVRLARQAHIPSAALVWWRAQLRARQEAARRVHRPIAFVQILSALGGLVAAALAALALHASLGLPQTGLESWTWLAPSLESSALFWSDSGPLFAYFIPLIVLTWMILGPAAVYLALRRER